jgi:hypothetical protein
VRVQGERAMEPRSCVGGVAEAALDHAAVEELERVLRAEAGAPLRVASASAQRPFRASAQPRTSSPSIEGRSARPTRPRSSAWRSVIPWSTWKSAISRSVRTPFAASSFSIAPIRAYCLRRARLACGAVACRPRAQRTAAAGSGRPPRARRRSPARGAAAREHLAEGVEPVGVAGERLQASRYSRSASA